MRFAIQGLSDRWRFGAMLLTVALLAACGQESSEEAEAPAEPEAPALEASAPAEPAADVEPVASQTDDGVPTGRLSQVAVPQAYKLDFVLNPDAEGFSGESEITVELSRTLDTLYLHSKDLEISRVLINPGSDREVTASVADVDPSGVIAVTPEKRLRPGSHVLRFSFTGTYQRGSKGFFKTTLGADSYIYTQFEAIDARLAFPGFDDPQFKTPFDLSVTAPQGMTAIATTPIVDQSPVDDGLVKYTYATTKPLPTYLIAFAVGPFDVVETPGLAPNEVRQEVLPFRAVTVRGRGDKLAYAIRNTQPIMDYIETYFGIAHPFPKLDIIASPEFAFGGMENVGAIVYRSPLLEFDSLDPPLGPARSYGIVHAHEIAHQWFGNYVTPVWWNDIWLNESFANWMGNKTAAAWRPELETGNINLITALATMRADARATTRAVREPVNDNSEISSSFDGITYRKGGGVLEMFENYLGEETFRDSVRLHMSRFAYGNADADDFAESLAQGAEQPDIVPAFLSFITQPGVPLLEIEKSCSDANAVLKVRQSRYFPLGSDGDPDQTWGVPACFTIDGEKQCQIISAAESEIAVPNCPDVVMPNSGGSGYYRFTLDKAGWTALLNNFEELSGREVLVVANNMAAAFEAGKIDFTTLVKAAEKIARHPLRQAAINMTGLFERLIDRVADTDTKAALRQWLVGLYGPQLADVGYFAKPDDTPQTRLKRASFADLVALLGRDDAALAAYAEKGAAVIGYDGNTPDRDAISRDLTPVALTAAVLINGRPYAEALLEAMLASPDGRFRQQAIAALTGFEDQRFAERLLSLAGTRQIRDNEMPALVFGLGGQDALRPIVFSWLGDNIDQVVDRLGFLAKGQVPRFASLYCDADAAAPAYTFFEDNLAKMPGGARTLREAQETVALCQALVEAKRDEVALYFQ